MTRYAAIPIAVLTAAVMTLTSPPAQAAQPGVSPVPGRFCKTADAGKVVKTAKYGKVKCAKKSGRYRWIDIPG